LEIKRGEVTGLEEIETSSVGSVKALKEVSSGAVSSGTVIAVDDGPDIAVHVSVDISLDRITGRVAVGDTEKVVGCGVEGGTVMVAVDGTGKAAGGGGWDDLLKSMLGKSSSSIIKSSPTSISLTFSLW